MLVVKQELHGKPEPSGSSTVENILWANKERIRSQRVKRKMRVIPPCRQPEEPQAGQVKPPEACSSPTHYRPRDRHVPREKHFLLPGRREQTASPAVAKKSVYAQIYDLMRKRKLKMLTKLREVGLYMISSFFPLHFSSTCLFVVGQVCQDLFDMGFCASQADFKLMEQRTALDFSVLILCVPKAGISVLSHGAWCRL